MTGRVMISGSVAYDTIMVFDGHFKDHILANQVHMLNVSFLTPRLKREFGGCAANIAYSLKQLGGDPLVLAAVGRDGSDYLQRLRALGIDTARVRAFDDQYTAQAFITTDLSDNQITAFHPGAMGSADQVSAQSEGERIAWGIVAPNGKAAMMRHASEFAAQGIPFIFDPGQGLPMFDGADLRHFIELATWVTVNDYEGKMLSDRTGMDSAAISAKVQGLVVTLGEHGCEVWQQGHKQTVAPVKAEAVVDPTGCGDAWRSALLYGLDQGWDLVRCAELGNKIGAIKIASRGPQNYTLT